MDIVNTEICEFVNFSILYLTSSIKPCILALGGDLLGMEVIFKDDSLDKLETDSGFDGGYQPGIVKAFRKRMQQIRAALDERDFYSQKSLRFEKLKGDRKHQYSIRLNDQWRLILEFKGKNPHKIVIIVCIEDYH